MRQTQRSFTADVTIAKVVECEHSCTLYSQLITSKLMKFVAEKIVRSIIGKAMHNKGKLKSISNFDNLLAYQN